MMSYHFAGHEDLLTACCGEIEQVTSAFMHPSTAAADGHVSVLRAYVESNVSLVGVHPAAVRALIDIVRNVPAQCTDVYRRLTVYEEHFPSGQAAGAFRPFDIQTVTLALTSGLDAVVVTAAADVPGPAELARIGRELADL